MRKIFEWSLLVAGVALLVAGCFQDPSRNKCIPTKGVLLVDGKPLAGVQVIAFALEQDARHPEIPSGITDDKGEFRLMSYVPGDGCPEGEYQLGFMHLGENGNDIWRLKFKMPPGGAKRYQISGASVDLGTIELKTQ